MVEFYASGALAHTALRPQLLLLDKALHCSRTIVLTIPRPRPVSPFFETRLTSRGSISLIFMIWRRSVTLNCIRFLERPLKNLVFYMPSQAGSLLCQMLKDHMQSNGKNDLEALQSFFFKTKNTFRTPFMFESGYLLNIYIFYFKIR